MAGEARHGAVSLGLVRYGEAWCGRRGKARYGLAWPGETGRGKVGRGRRGTEIEERRSIDDLQMETKLAHRH